MEWSAVKSQHDNAPSIAKLLALTTGSTALIAMGVLTVAVSEHTPDPQPQNMNSESSLGETSTKSTAPSALETSFATPAITSTESDG
jgi:hypothetical protein